MGSHYYSELELCIGVVTVSFLKYFPWQAIHFLQHSTHFSKTCCRLLITLKFLALELPFHDWKNPKIAWGDQLFPSQMENSIQIKPHAISELFQL
jgi:hypothetical protein